MLYLSPKLYNIPLLSIRSAGRIGTVTEPIINPHNLHIDGFYCQVPAHNTKLVLLDVDIRDLLPKGIIIDDNRNLSEPEDLVRLKSILDLNFKILDKPVLAGKKKIGKLVEYAIEKESLFILKLYVQPPIWQSVNQHQLTFDRSSVVEVTDTHIVVSGPEERAAKEAKAIRGSYSTNTSLMIE